MVQILVRNVDPKAVERLKARTRRHGRSLQSEVKVLLERAAGVGAEEVAAMLAGWEKRLGGRRFVSCAKLIREDRSR